MIFLLIAAHCWLFQGVFCVFVFMCLCVYPRGFRGAYFRVAKEPQSLKVMTSRAVPMIAERI